MLSKRSRNYLIIIILCLLSGLSGIFYQKYYPDSIITSYMQLYNKTQRSLSFTGLFSHLKPRTLKESTSTESPVSGKVVEVETVQPTTFYKTLSLIGTVQAKHSSQFLAKSPGEIHLFVRPGQFVKKGAMIAKILNPNLEKDVQLSIHTERLAREQYLRYSSFSSTGAISRISIEEKKQQWIDSQKEVVKSKTDLDHMILIAPFDGIVGAFKMKDGSFVNEGDRITTIYDPHHLVLDFDVPCDNISHQHINNLASISLKDSRVRLFGKIYKLSYFQDMLDENTHMCPARSDIQCEDCTVGMSTPFELITAKKENSIAVREPSVFIKNSRPYIYRIVKHIAVLTPVELGDQERDFIEITQGLYSGEQIVLTNPERINPGERVSLVSKSLG